MSGAVHLEQATAASWQATGTDGVPNLQQVAADRLAAHRARRAAAAAQESEAEVRARLHREAVRTAKRDDQRRGASLVRDAVKARYEQRESYREFLAAEAERAIAQAQAEAEVANRNARAVAEAQMALLDELEELNRPDPGPREQAIAKNKSESRAQLAHALADIVLGARELIDEPPLLTVTEAAQSAISFAPAEPAATAVREVSAAGLTVRLFEDIGAVSQRGVERTTRRGGDLIETPAPGYWDEETADTLSALEDEIDFRRAPEFPRATVLETESIPGNLIEFPRELVAPRRARPRLAEGPLRDEPGQPQLRIFEVDPEQIRMEPMSLTLNPIPEWQTLHLSGFEAAPASDATASEAQTHITLPVQTASLERRLMSASVDVCCVTAAWLVAAACAVETAGPALRSVPLPLAALAGLLSFAFFSVAYQLLFFSLADGTPGMRYARIALCTFGDGNPSRRAMRRRVLSSVVAACPLGLGLAWTLLDNEKLGWHDRMSRMYQRAY